MTRVLKALAAYLVVGGAVWLALDPIRRVFVLPALFTVAARGLILALLPVVLAVAWRYPKLGAADADGDPGSEG